MIFLTVTIIVVGGISLAVGIFAQGQKERCYIGCTKFVDKRKEARSALPSHPGIIHEVTGAVWNNRVAEMRNPSGPQRTDSEVYTASLGARLPARHWRGTFNDWNGCIIRWDHDGLSLRTGCSTAVALFGSVRIIVGLVRL